MTCSCFALTLVLVDLLAACLGSSRLKPPHRLGHPQAYELHRPVCLVSAFDQHLCPAFWAQPPEVISRCHRALCQNEKKRVKSEKDNRVTNKNVTMCQCKVKFGMALTFVSTLLLLGVGLFIVHCIKHCVAVVRAACSSLFWDTNRTQFCLRHSGCSVSNCPQQRSMLSWWKLWGCDLNLGSPS